MVAVVLIESIDKQAKTDGEYLGCGQYLEGAQELFAGPGFQREDRILPPAGTARYGNQPGTLHENLAE